MMKKCVLMLVIFVTSLEALCQDYFFMPVSEGKEMKLYYPAYQLKYHDSLDAVVDKLYNKNARAFMLDYFGSQSNLIESAKDRPFLVMGQDRESNTSFQGISSRVVYKRETQDLLELITEFRNNQEYINGLSGQATGYELNSLPTTSVLQYFSLKSLILSTQKRFLEEKEKGFSFVVIDSVFTNDSGSPLDTKELTDAFVFAYNLSAMSITKMGVYANEYRKSNQRWFPCSLPLYRNEIAKQYPLEKCPVLNLKGFVRSVEQSRDNLFIKIELRLTFNGIVVDKHIIEIQKNHSGEFSIGNTNPLLLIAYKNEKLRQGERKELFIKSDNNMFNSFESDGEFLSNFIIKKADKKVQKKAPYYVEMQVKEHSSDSLSISYVLRHKKHLKTVLVIPDEQERIIKIWGSKEIIIPKESIKYAPVFFRQIIINDINNIEYINL